ncbi:MAG: FixH family protein [Rhodothermales bacterium]
MTPTPLPESGPFAGDGHAAADEVAPPRKPPLIPSHIAWPGFVIALLLLSIFAAFQAFFAAQSDGGAQVVEAYYDSAIAFDDEQAAQAASNALGWSAGVEVGACEGGLCAVDVVVRDREGAPVEGLNGLLRVSRPQSAATVARIPLASSDAPGVYRQFVPLNADGLWDFAVTARRGDEQFVTEIRRDVAR